MPAFHTGRAPPPPTDGGRASGPYGAIDGELPKPPSMQPQLAAALALGIPIAIVIICLLTSCSAPERRDNCAASIEPHARLPYPAGVIVVRCDGVERVRITAKRVYSAQP